MGARSRRGVVIGAGIGGVLGLGASVLGSAWALLFAMGGGGGHGQPVRFGELFLGLGIVAALVTAAGAGLGALIGALIGRLTGALLRAGRGEDG